MRAPGWGAYLSCKSGVVDVGEHLLDERDGHLAGFVVAGGRGVLLQSFGEEEHAVDVPLTVVDEWLDDFARACEIDGVETVVLFGVLEPEVLGLAGDFEVLRVASEVVVDVAVDEDPAALIPVVFVVADAGAVVVEGGHEAAKLVVDAVLGPERKLNFEKLGAIGVPELLEVVAGEFVAGGRVALGNSGGGVVRKSG